MSRIQEIIAHHAPAIVSEANDCKDHQRALFAAASAKSGTAEASDLFAQADAAGSRAVALMELVPTHLLGWCIICSRYYVIEDDAEHSC